MRAWPRGSSMAYLLAAALCGGHAVAQTPMAPPGFVEFPAPAVPSLGEDGAVVVAVTVDGAGAVTDAVVLTATHRTLASATERAARAWRMSPSGDGTRTGSVRREILELQFRRGGEVVSSTHAESARAWFHSGPPAISTVLRDELATPPRCTVGPVDGESAAMQPERGGSATVSFIIDSAGRVRVPVIVSAGSEMSGRAALAQLARWRCEPARFEGRVVLVEDRRTFTFPDPAS